MSKKRNDFVEADVTVADMQEMLNDTANATLQETKQPKPKKHVMSRLWALILAVAPIALLCVFPTLLLVKSASGYAIETEKTMLDAFTALVKELIGKNGLSKFYDNAAPAQFEGFKAFGLPLLTGSGFYGKIYSLALYTLPVAMLLNVVLMIVALFSGKHAPKLARAIAFVDLFAFGSYILGLLGFAKYQYLEVKYLSTPVYVLGGIAAFALLVYLVYSFAKVKKLSWANFFIMLFTAVWVAAFFYPYLFVNAKTSENVRFAIAELEGSSGKALIPVKFFKYIVWGIGGLSVLFLFVSAVRLSTKKGFALNIICSVVAFLVAAFAIVLSFTTDIVKELEFMDFKLYPIIAAVAALLQIIIAASTRNAVKKAKAKAKPKTLEAAVQVEETPVAEQPKAEETMEAVRYDYAAELVPVEEETAKEEPVIETPAEEPAVETPVVVEEETAKEEPAIETPVVVEEKPAEEPQEAPQTTNAYDYYNSKSFDPFIASLNDEERKQFTEIFILKYKGETKNLPDYEVGGDNAEFFRRVFIFLGQYREKIPSKLLAKMYNFASKK